MNPEQIQHDIISIVAKASRMATLTSLTLDATPSDLNFDMGAFLIRLGVDPSVEPYRSARSIRDMVRCLQEAKPEVVERLAKDAANARVRRLLWATLSVSPDLVPADNPEKWWYELASQVLWWHASELCASGRRLVQASAPVRAATALLNLDLLDMHRLSAPSGEDVVDVTRALLRIGYDADAANSAVATLSAIAGKLATTFGGKPKKALRRHADELAAGLCRDLLPADVDHEVNRKAVRSWVTTLTSLPVSVLSPSAVDFVRKFADAGLSEVEFYDAAENEPVDFAAIDQALCLFMDETCRHCDPDSPDQRLCQKRFKPLGWDVDCVRGPSR